MRACACVQHARQVRETGARGVCRHVVGRGGSVCVCGGGDAEGPGGDARCAGQGGGEWGRGAGGSW